MERDNPEELLLHTDEPQLFGHPTGLYYLFFAELWERFSFYGMKALLMLYMVLELYAMMGEEAAKARGFGIYAAYGALVYATPIIGGMLADKVLGYRKAIVFGGILMALGHFALAVEHPVFFFMALGLLIAGNGFFKPNISTMVGSLYAEGDPRRDSGFTIFYMGINIGAWASPLICGWLAYAYGWHYGFGAAGVGMLIGLAVFLVGMKKNVFRGRGKQPDTYATNKMAGINMSGLVYLGAVLLVPLFAFLVYRNDFEILRFIHSILGMRGQYETILSTDLMSVLLFAVLAVILTYLISILIKVGKVERERLLVVMILTFFITVFWSFFEQAGSSLTLFAEENVNLVFMNAAQTNSINPGYIILFAIPFSFMWVWLSRKGLNPYTPVKFSFAIFQLGLGFLIFAYSARFMDEQGMVPVTFLLIGYLLITTGELFISPIGLSKVTELSPKRIVSFMMGVFFLSSAFANHIAGIIAKLTITPGVPGVDAEAVAAADSDGGIMGQIIFWVTGFPDGTTDSTVRGVQTLANYTAVFAQIGVVAIGMAVLVLIMFPILKKWMHGIH